jgi:4-hydroxy-tetrahydrodipicolinate synthase
MTLRIDRHSSGVFIIAATPFTDQGALDLDSTDRLIDFYLEKRVTGMTILGMMGEAPKLNAEESRTVVERIMKRVNGQIPVIVGVSGAGLDNLAALSLFAMEQGAAGVMVAPNPGQNTAEKVLGYYGAVCQALGPDIPICFQDYPQTTTVHVSPATILTMTRELPQVVMLKHEDCPGHAKLSAVRQGSGTGDTPRMSILTGNGGLYLPQEMARGADGAMTGFAYPEMLVGVVEKFQAGDPTGAEDLFDAYLPLVRHEQQPGLGLAIRKETLRRRGVIASAKVRAPGPSLSATDHEELTGLIARMEAKVAALG